MEKRFLSFDDRSRFVDPANDEEIHHDLFVDVLRYAMKRRGTIRGVATRSGYSEQYLHLILNKRRNIPSPEALESIIAAIPGMTSREASSLRHYARRAAGDRGAPRRSLRLVLEEPEVIPELERLEQVSHVATHAPTPEATRHGLFEVRTHASWLAKSIRDPAASPHAYVRLCLLLNHVQSFLDDPWDALRWARFALAVLEEAEERETIDAATRKLDDLRVAALLAEAVALHNLDGDRQALSRYDLASWHLANVPDDPRQTYIAMGRISALAGTRRFRIGDVKKLVDDVQRLCDMRSHPDTQQDLLVSRANRGLANAYVQHGDLKPRTERLLTEELEHIDRLVLAGPIHKVQLYRTFARFCAARGDREGLAHFATIGLRAAEAAGLDHQARRLKADLQGLTVDAEPSGIPA